MKKNLLLIGMPGSGKSTLAKKIAQKYFFDFIDTDQLIEEKQQKTLQSIINTYGLDKAQQIEEQTLKNLHKQGCVISTGGSAIYYHQAMLHLKKQSVIFFLDVSLNKLLKRIHNLGNRGIIMEKTQTFEDLFIQRHKLYTKYTDFTIDNNTK